MVLTTTGFVYGNPAFRPLPIESTLPHSHRQKTCHRW